VRQRKYSEGAADETIRSYKHAFNLFIKLVPELTLDNLNTEMITTFNERLSTRTRTVGKGVKKKGVKNSTLLTYRSKLNSFFEWLKKNEKIKRNPYESLRYPKVTYTDTRFLKQEQVERIFTTISMHTWSSLFAKKRNLALFGVALHCGLRRGEILGLRVLDIDMKRRLLTVRAETSKSKEQREIPISRYLAQLLDDYMGERNKRELSTIHLFASSTQDRELTLDGLKHLVERVKQISGVTFHMHRFRHTFAVNIIFKKGGIYQLQKLMGHKDINMTTKYLRGFPAACMRSEVNLLDLRNLV